MASGHGRERVKGKKAGVSENNAEKVRPAGKAARKKPGYTMEILALIVIVVIIAVVFMLYSSDYTYHVHTPNATSNATNAETCVSMNPGATEQGCLDSAYQREAIKNDDPEICKMIKSETLRHHCLRYFGLVR